MKGLKNEFVQPPYRKFKFMLGSVVATPLTGFIAGFLAAAIVLVPLSLWICRYSETTPIVK